MLPQPLTGRMDGVGEVFRTKPSGRGTTRPLKFLRTVIFLKIKRDEKIMIKMSSLLGFDPVSRRRNPVETEEEDELDRLE